MNRPALQLLDRLRARLDRPPRTRYAPSPSGLLHLGHVVNAIYVWGLARALAGTVVLRIEDHDRERSRAAWEEGILEELEWLGLRPDEGSPIPCAPARRTFASRTASRVTPGGPRCSPMPG